MAKASGTIDLKGMKKASQQATNYMSTDSSGVMVADMTNGIYNPSTIISGKNVLITDDDVKIRDGQQQLASYGESTVIGKIGTDSSSYGSNIKITKQSISGNKIGIVGYDSGIAITDDIETFAINIGSGETTQSESEAVYKTSGDSVIYNFTPTYAQGNNEPFQVYTKVYLINESEIVSSSTVFNSNPSMSELITSQDIEVDAGQTISVDMLYNKTNNSVTVTVKDEDITSQEYKINYIKVVALYNSGTIDYPHFRFGTYNAYNGQTQKKQVNGKFAFNVGQDNDTTGNYSFAHGIDSGAIGASSFVSGGYNVTTGDYSFAQGNGNRADGSCSQVFGMNNTATGDYSHVTGVGNVAKYNDQTVMGKYAIPTTSDDLFVIGNGTGESSRSYAMRLKNNGRVEFDGAVGSGLEFESRSQMVNIMKGLSLHTPYNFFASSTITSSGTTYWGTTAGATAANAFGTICKMSATAWHMFFMCGGNMYKSTFTWDGGSTTTGTFNTKQLATV